MALLIRSRSEYGTICPMYTELLWAIPPAWTQVPRSAAATTAVFLFTISPLDDLVLPLKREIHNAGFEIYHKMWRIPFRVRKLLSAGSDGARTISVEAKAAWWLLSRTGDGAGEGNRTLVLSLGSFRSTIELHPRSIDFTTFPSASDPRQRSTPLRRVRNAVPCRTGE